MVRRLFQMVCGLGLLLALTLTQFGQGSQAAGAELDICGLVQAEELAALSRKTLFPTGQDSGCFWSLTPGGMAYLHIAVHDMHQPLRDYFFPELPSHVRLEYIDDLGDEGLMTVTEGTLGVVVIRKGQRVIQSAVTFLEIEPGSPKQQALWNIYRRILDRI